MKVGYPIVFVFTIASCLGLAQTIAPNQYITWGIGADELTIPSGSMITEAVLTVEGLSPENQPFYIHLLDDTPQGLTVGVDRCQCNRFDSCGIPLTGVFENGKWVCRLSQIDDAQSALRNVFSQSNTVRLADGTSVTLSSAVLEMMDYAGNGYGFGIGFDAYQDGLNLVSARLELTLKSYVGGQDSTLTFTFGTPQRSWEFEDGSFTGWQVVDEGAVEGPSRWGVVNGELVQASNIHSYEPAEGLRKQGTYLLFAEGLGIEDYQIQYHVRSLDDDAFGVMFRVQDQNNYYRFSWDRQRLYRRLVKNVNGVFTLLAQDRVPYNPRQDYQVTVEAVGSQITVFVDGQEVFSVADESFRFGTFGLYSWASAGVFFDHVAVRGRE